MTRTLQPGNSLLRMRGPGGESFPAGSGGKGTSVARSPGRRRHAGAKGRCLERAARLALFSLVLGCLCPSPALAYLDPGTGSMLASALIGIAATLLFFLKNAWYAIVGRIYALMGRASPRESGNIVFFSEGRQYWNTFKPVLEALHNLEHRAVFLSADAGDPGLGFASPHIATRFIGSGSRAFAVLNMLEADLCVMTTPNLDVLQITRSPGVAHYAHLVHACTDMAFYKLFAFDYFDSVLCSGPHQMRSLRHLEKLRGTREKVLLETGCCYLDVMAEAVRQRDKNRAPGDAAEAARPRVLVAPTWGRNGLLRLFGESLLLPLAREGFDLCIRPHPQSVRHERAMLDGLRRALAPFANVRWDTEPDGLPAMLDSTVLISDVSGIVFDYAFILERPVITVRFTPDPRGLEASDLPWPAWELDMLPKLGACVEPSAIGELPRLVRSLPERAAFSEFIRGVRAASLFHAGSSGITAARQLIALQRGLRSSKKESP